LGDILHLVEDRTSGQGPYDRSNGCRPSVGVIYNVVKIISPVYLQYKIVCHARLLLWQNYQLFQTTRHSRPLNQVQTVKLQYFGKKMPHFRRFW